MRDAVTTILLDAVEVGPNGKGIERVLTSVVPRLVALRPDVYLAATTAPGIALLGLPAANLRVVKAMPDTVWEQFGLAAVARRVKADAIYTHREAGPLWGPPCLLHVPEDPEVRWGREPARSRRERLRRAYSRTLMRPSLRRSHVSTSTAAVWGDLHQRRLVGREVCLTPLGIDPAVFHPVGDERRRTLFHLGSADDRDNLPAVLRAFEAVAEIDPLARLEVAGSLGAAQRDDVKRWALAGRTKLLGRVSDAELAAGWGRCHVAVQPSTDEGFGLQALEALACGAALVVAPGESVEEVVASAAAVAGSGNPADVARAVAELWLDGDRLEALRSGGPLHTAAHTWDVAAQRIDDLLMRLAHQSR